MAKTTIFTDVIVEYTTIGYEQSHKLQNIGAVQLIDLLATYLIDDPQEPNNMKILDFDNYDFYWNDEKIDRSGFDYDGVTCYLYNASKGLLFTGAEEDQNGDWVVNVYYPSEISTTVIMQVEPKSTPVVDDQEFLNKRGLSHYDSKLKTWVQNGIASKQDTLVSGTNIKTVNNTNLLGSGNIDVNSTFIATINETSAADLTAAINAGKQIIIYAAGSQNVYYSVSVAEVKSSIRVKLSVANADSNQLYLYSIIDGSGGTPSWNLSIFNLQAKLTSGTNIKTINNTSLLDSGNLSLQPTITAGSNLTFDGNTLYGSNNAMAFTSGTLRSVMQNNRNYNTFYKGGSTSISDFPAGFETSAGTIHVVRSPDNTRGNAYFSGYENTKPLFRRAIVGTDLAWSGDWVYIGGEPVKLWENSAKTSDFAVQNVAIPGYAQYRKFLIVYKMGKSLDNYITLEIPISSGGISYRPLMVNSNDLLMYRITYLQSAGTIHFDYGVQVKPHSGTGGNDNQYMIPCYIYGC